MNTKNPLKILKQIHKTSTIYQKLARGIRDLGGLFTILAASTQMSVVFTIVGACLTFFGGFLVDLFTKETIEEN